MVTCWLQAKFWFWPVEILLWRSTQDQLEIFGVLRRLERSQSWIYVIPCSPCLYVPTDTHFSLCWLCCLRSVSRPHRAQSASPQPASMSTLRTLCTSRSRSASLSSARIPNSTTWYHITPHSYYVVRLYHELSCLFPVCFITTPAPPAGRGNQGSDRNWSILIQYSFKALILILFPHHLLSLPCLTASSN